MLVAGHDDKGKGQENDVRLVSGACDWTDSPENEGEKNVMLVQRAAGRTSSKGYSLQILLYPNEVLLYPSTTVPPALLFLQAPFFKPPLQRQR